MTEDHVKVALDDLLSQESSNESNGQRRSSSILRFLKMFNLVVFREYVETR
jgi:hypothetical protein